MNIIYQTDINVRIYDINYGNHLGHDSVISLLHEARVRFLRSLGFTESNIDGLGILITRLEVDYLNQAFYQDNLTISIAIDNVSKASLYVYYEIENQQKNLTIAKAMTKMTFFDYEQQKVARIPEKFLEKINFQLK